jgi:hypothetical protein
VTFLWISHGLKTDLENSQVFKATYVARPLCRFGHTVQN